MEFVHVLYSEVISLLLLLQDLPSTGQFHCFFRFGAIQTKRISYTTSKCKIRIRLTFLESTLFVIKGARSDRCRFFSNFQRFWYQKKACIFLITPGDFYSWKMNRFKDINENVTSNGNHN